MISNPKSDSDRSTFLVMIFSVVFVFLMQSSVVLYALNRSGEHYSQEAIEKQIHSEIQKHQDAAYQEQALN